MSRRSHGRRYASAKTIARKQAKAQIRKANTQLRKLKKTKLVNIAPLLRIKPIMETPLN